MSDSYKVYASKDYVDNKITGMQVATETLQAGSDATAQWDGEAGLLTLGIPIGVGPKGDKGDPGPVGPQGPKGDTGPAGAAGPSAYAAAQAGGYTGTEATFYADLAAMQNLAAELAAM